MLSGVGQAKNGMASGAPIAACFVPAKEAQLSPSVVLNHPDTIYGEKVSAPLWRDVMSYALRHFGIAPPKVAYGAPEPCSVAK